MSLEVGPTGDLAACQALRRVVFIQEQSVPEAVEQDGRDATAHHILARSGGIPVGCARILIAGETGKIGRVCVLPPYRGQGVGHALVKACVAHLQALPGVTRAELGAQTHALGLYEALGFTTFGDEFADACGLPHLMMERPL